MVREEKRTFEFVGEDIVDTRTGMVRTPTGSLKPRKLPYWGRRMALVSSRWLMEFFMKNPPLNLFELALVWPEVFTQAHTLDDFWKWLFQVRWRFNQVFKSLGLRIGRPDPTAMNFQVTRVFAANISCDFTVEQAAAHLTEAMDRFRANDSATALTLARRAVTGYPEYLPAWLMIGRLLMADRTASGSDPFVMKAADCIFDYERLLAIAVPAVTLLPRQRERQDRRQAVEDFVAKTKGQMEELESLFNWAKEIAEGEQ